MTKATFRPPASARSSAEPAVVLLMQALQTMLPTSFIDLLLDRIEVGR